MSTGGVQTGAPPSPTRRATARCAAAPLDAGRDSGGSGGSAADTYSNTSSIAPHGLRKEIVRFVQVAEDLQTHSRTMRSLSLLLVLLHAAITRAFIPLIDGGKTFPKLYDGYFNEQICKQASTAVSRAISAGKRNIQVEFPPVPNVEEVKFGTPLNLKFGKTTVARDLKVKGGYKPGASIWSILQGQITRTHQVCRFKYFQKLGGVLQCVLGQKNRERSQRISCGGQASRFSVSQCHALNI